LHDSLLSTQVGPATSAIVGLLTGVSPRSRPLCRHPFRSGSGLALVFGWAAPHRPAALPRATPLQVRVCGLPGTPRCAPRCDPPLASAREGEGNRDLAQRPSRFVSSGRSRAGGRRRPRSPGFANRWIARSCATRFGPTRAGAATRSSRSGRCRRRRGRCSCRSRRRAAACRCSSTSSGLPVTLTRRARLSPSSPGVA